MDEQQFILRLPEALVEPMRFALSSNKKRETAGDERKPSSFSVDFTDARNAVFTVDGTPYPATLMDFPTLVETHKTADKRTFYKSGDIHQALVVRMPDDPKPESFVLKDGLTPASRDAARRLAPPKRLFSQAQVESVEHRVKLVIDHKIKIVAKKDTKPQPADEELVEIEEETTAADTSNQTGDAAADAGSEKVSKTLQNTNEETPTGAAPAVASGAPTAAGAVEVAGVGDGKSKDGKVGESGRDERAGERASGDAATAASPMGEVSASPMPQTPAAMTPQVMTPQVMTPQVMTPGAMTPMPDGEDDEDDEDDEDFAEMAGALLEDDEEEEAKKRIERANLDQKIVEQKEKIRQVEERAAKAPNHVLRQRILAKKVEMEKALRELEKERTELGD
eukprot:GFKZ01003465.1.p1 GENE.GFKZ01003465.1~~GFKZ01003465.1.p1  ORF type:complete len:394 (+),score=104.14 GFKZ01003465.1:2697-3878(+)